MTLFTVTRHGSTFEAKTDNAVTLMRYARFLSETDRFWLQTQKGDPDECWTWQGSRGGHGYGCLKVQGKTMAAHRFSWVLHFGDIPKGMFVCHSCDNRPCVNPAHLFLGTPKQNMDDMWQKQRGRPLRGASLPQTKLTEQKVREIRRLSSHVSKVEIARRFGVSTSAIRSVVRRENWRWVS